MPKMVDPWKKMLYLAGVATFLAIGWGGIEPAAAQPAGGASREHELGRIREKVQELRLELAELEATGTSVEAELERLKLDLRLQQQMVAEAVAERALAESTLRLSETRIEALEEELAETRGRLGQRILDLYEAAPTDWLRGFITVRAPGDFFLYLRTLRYLARRDALLVGVYREEQAELEAERRRLAEREREVARSEAQERGRLVELEEANRRQARVAKALELERARIELEASSLDDKERKLALLIAVLASQGDPALSEKPIQDFRGALDWPIAGKISIPFGPRYEPRYGTSVPHNGVQITPSGGGVITTVFSGVVIFAAPFEGFGLTVVVHHPNQVFSLYAGLEELSVSKDDVVVLSQVLGRTGSPLYFELRVENRPEDPMRWLR
jgi:septal ring factor EnvC (AmiA/AmiB activator)